MTPTKVSNRIKTFTNHHPYVGPISWILSLQYFISQVFVAQAWNPPYSWSLNTISDLGNTQCGQYHERFICSPHYPLMNASLIILGITIALGSALIYYGFKRSFWSYIGFSMMAIAGVGAWFVGAFPEDTISQLHIVGAAMPFLFGNISLIILGLTLEIPRWFKYLTVLSGALALVALLFFLKDEYLIFGLGGMERIVAYPQTLWLIVFGIYVSAHRYQENVRKSH